MNIANSIRAKCGVLYLIGALISMNILFLISANAQTTRTPGISITPGSVNFGPLRTGVQSAPKVLTVKNTGKSDLVISSFTMTGNDASEFNQTNNCNVPVHAGGTCTVSVTLTPEPPFGNKKATLNVDSNDPKKPTVRVNLMGQASAPVISANPMSINLGSVSTGQTSERTITIKDTGKSDLSIISMTITGQNAQEFSANSICSPVLTSGDKCTVTVSFSPATIGRKTAWLDVISNDPKKFTLTIKLLGVATAYSLVDLEGIWELNSLASGPGAPWWERGSLIIHADGTFTSTSVVQSDGSPDNISGTFSISAKGLITIKGNANARLRMDSGKTVIAGTSTWKGEQAGTTNLFVLTKKADSYSLADLVGTWKGNSLASGSGAPWWERADLTINADGTFTASTVESTGAVDNKNGTLQISSDGIVTSAGDATFRCSMDSHKTSVVCTDTWSNDLAGTAEMKILTKMADSYSMADVVGVWNGNSLHSGSAPGWERDTVTIGADGTSTGSGTESTGRTNKITGTLQISSDGIITVQDNDAVRCTMDSDKTILVCTESWVEGANVSSAPVLIDAFQFSGTQNYCCWTSEAYTWFTSNFFDPNSSSGWPSNAVNAPDGKYSEMRAPGFSLMTGTNAVPQNGIKVYIASGNTATYEVWGGSMIPTSLCGYGTPYYTCDLLDLGNNPENYGFTYLGRSNTTQEFPGSYLYYIVNTGPEETTSIEIFTKTPN